MLILDIKNATNKNNGSISENRFSTSRKEEHPAENEKTGFAYTRVSTPTESARNAAIIAGAKIIMHALMKCTILLG